MVGKDKTSWLKWIQGPQDYNFSDLNSQSLNERFTSKLFTCLLGTCVGEYIES